MTTCELSTLALPISDAMGYSMGTEGEAPHHPLSAMMNLEMIGYSSTIYRDNDAGKSRAEETLALAIETAGPGETFDLFHNGRGWIIRMFEDGEFVQTI